MAQQGKITKKIGCLIYDDFTAMDVIGPLEVFAIANDLAAVNYQLFTIAQEKRAYKSESGISLVAEKTLDEVSKLDTLIIPGGKGARCTSQQAQHNEWLQAMLANTRRVISVCTGAYLLAATGALNNKQATTHWHFLPDFERQFPEIEVIPDALFIDHGNIATSAGISSGIDLALKLVENDCGATTAVNIARYLVLHYRRAGNQAQYSLPLQHQQLCCEEFSDLTGWILENLNNDLSIETLADRAGMSPRNFCRKFKQQMKTTPAKYVEALRLDFARQLLTEQDWQLDKIARNCGYHNLDVFRRAFERRFIISPNIYRARFSDL